MATTQILTKSMRSPLPYTCRALKALVDLDPNSDETYILQSRCNLTNEFGELDQIDADAAERLRTLGYTVVSEGERLAPYSYLIVIG